MIAAFNFQIHNLLASSDHVNSVSSSKNPRLLCFRFPYSLPSNLQRATGVRVAIVPAFFCGLLVRVSVAADWAVVDTLVDLYRFDSVFLNSSIPLEAGALFQAIFGIVDFVLEFSSQGIPWSISNQAVDRAAVAKEEKCWGAHDSILSSNFAVSFAGEDVQPRELQFSGEVSRDRVQRSARGPAVCTICTSRARSLRVRAALIWLLVPPSCLILGR